MPWVERVAGKIIGAYANRQDGYAEEYVDDNAIEVSDFISSRQMEMTPSISDRQFFQQLAILKIISQDDALSAVKVGSIPAPLQSIIDGLPQDQKFGAEMIISGATTFNRAHPMTMAMGASYGWSSSQIDDFFKAAAQL